MNTFRTLSICILAFFTTSIVSAQYAEFQNNLEFKIQLLADGNYGVFVKPDHTVSPSGKTQTGSGQVTLVVPSNFTYTNFTNVSGTWIENARVDSPVEATDKAYVSFGFVVDNPRIKLYANEETLLFTFATEGAFNGQIALFDNENDPFMTPNSYGSNPGNDLGVIDLGAKGGMVYYNYARNYSTEAAELRESLTMASK